MTTNGTVTPAVPAGVASDGAGNTNPVATRTDGTVSWDAAAPTVAITQAAGQADPTSGTTINFTVVFSEAVTGFATGDVTLSGTAGGTKVATVTGSGTIIATIPAARATDLAGNASSASTSTDNTVTR